MPAWPGERIARALQGPATLPRIDFRPRRRRCPACGAALLSQKSRTRTLCTLAAGCVLAREFRRRCPRCPAPPVGSSHLRRLAPPGQRFGYDLIAWVGLQRYHRMRQRQEIRADLARRGLPLSAGSLSALCDRFLLLLEGLHRLRAPALRAAMPQGYPLHLDATCDKGKGGLFVCLDGWRGWVLHAVRIRSESAAQLQPAIAATVTAFGPPVAFVRDLGTAGAKAVAACRTSASPDLVCHFHFLAAVGRKLMDADHAALRRGLTRLGVRSGLRAMLRTLCPPGSAPGAQRREQDLPALLLWILEGDGRKQPAHPFALAHWNLYRRCCEFREQARKRLPAPRSRRERRILRQAAELLEPLWQPPSRLPAVADRLAGSQAVFSELRQVLRLRHDALRRKPAAGPPSAQQGAELLASLAAAVRAYRKKLRARLERSRTDSGKAVRRPEAVVLDYLERYRDQLFGHPVARDAAGRAVAVVERTNNPAEHFFAQAKRRMRRRVGHAHLGRDMQDQPAQAALAANLLDPSYVRIVCGTLQNLPAAFSRADQSPALAGKRTLNRGTKHSELRRRIREWEGDQSLCLSPSQSRN